ncbi:MAG: hypothetical protein ACRCX2_17940 [Paraclostridium sp.]
MIKKILVGLMAVTTMVFARDNRGTVLKIEPVIEHGGEIQDLRLTIMVNGKPVVVDIERDYLREIEGFARELEKSEEINK